jgi:glycosyltransferase involved in cell wall biosynthesis
MSKNLSIILSTYNEELFIEETLKNIIKTFPECEIIIVDDSSKDNTINIIKKLKIKNIKLFERRSRGLASAFLLGLINSSKDTIGWIDSNQGKLIKKYPEMINLLDSNDLVLLSRYVDGGLDERNKKRVMTSKIINTLCKYVLGHAIKDYTSSMFVMRRTVLNQVIPIAYGHGEFFIEFLYKIKKSNLRIKEIPFTQEADHEELSKTASNIYRFINLGKDYIFRVFISLIRKN